MNEPLVNAGIPRSSKILCGVYAAIALAALVATWSQNLAYLGSMGALTTFLGTFFADTKVNPAARSITADILIFFLAAAVFMVIEARKHGIRFVWAYVIGGILIAISVTFPLFMIARELRICRSDPTRLTTGDVAGLALLTAFIGAFVIWLEVF